MESCSEKLLGTQYWRVSMIYTFTFYVCMTSIFTYSFFFSQKNSASKSFLEAIYKNVKTKASEDKQKPCVSELAV